MKKGVFAAALLASGLLLQGCDNTAVAPDSADQTITNASSRLGGGSYNTHLVGDQEVVVPPTPPVVTNATGQVNLKLSEYGTKLSYKLIVANIESVRFAHLHQASAGANGPVVVDLFMPPTPVISPQGVLAEGIITAASLNGGKPLSELVAAIEAANIYANIHSIKYPGSELRGLWTNSIRTQ